MQAGASGKPRPRYRAAGCGRGGDQPPAVPTRDHPILWGATTRRAKPLLRRTLIRPCGPPSPFQGEGFWTLILTFPPMGGRSEKVLSANGG